VRFERAKPVAAAIALTANRPDRATTSAAAVFFGPRLIHNLLEDFNLQGLLAEQPMQLAHLLLQGMILRSGNYRLAGAGRRQSALRRQTPPGEQPVRPDAMSPRHQTHRRIPLIRLLHPAHLLDRAPTPPSLH
jgi:hypothetical protein